MLLFLFLLLRFPLVALRWEAALLLEELEPGFRQGVGFQGVGAGFLPEPLAVSPRLRSGSVSAGG